MSNVMAELEYLSDRYNFNSLMIHDDSMTQDVNWVREFCEEYQRRGIRRPFWAQSRADFVCEHEEVLRMMAEAGLVGLSIGFESGSDRILRILRKGVSVQQNYEAAKLCKEYGIKIFANYMFGLPTETKDEVMATVHMIKQIRPDYHSCSFFTPFPGSELGEYCAENNLRITEDYSEYNRGRLTPKIRGVDYEFLLRAVDDARQLSSIGRFLRRLQRTSFAEEVIKWGAHFFPSRVLLIGLMRFMRHQTGRWGE